MYETLVRDGESPSTRRVQGDEHQGLLLAKIAELTAAYRVEKDDDRLADIFEVLISLSSAGKLNSSRTRLLERGGYAGGRVAEVSAPHTHAEAAFTQVAVKAVIWREGQLVCARKQDALGGQWEIPGGRLGLDDNPALTVRKEINEELGVDASSVGAILATGFADHLPGFLPLFYILYEVAVDDDVAFTLSDEHSAWALFDRERIMSTVADGSFNPALGRMLLDTWPDGS